MSSFLYTTQSFVVVGFALFFGYRWFRLRRDLSVYTRYGLVIASILISLSNAQYTLSGTHKLTGEVLLVGLIIALVTIPYISAFTIMGLYYSDLLRQPGFVLFQNKEKAVSRIPTSTTAGREILFGHDEVRESRGNPQITSKFTSRSTIQRQITQSPSIDVSMPSGTTVATKISLRKQALAILYVVVSGVAFTVILFLLTRPHIAHATGQELGIDQLIQRGQYALILSGISSSLENALLEEIIYRLGIQRYLHVRFGPSRGYYWLVIVLTAMLWTVGHAGILEPDWVKFVQLFPIGISFGWLSSRMGMESCITAHCTFNIVMYFLGSFLLP